MTNKEMCERINQALGGIETPRMQSDNLSIILCSHFDNPDQEQDDYGWSLDAVTGCDEVLDAIKAHYRPLTDRIEALSAEVERLREALGHVAQAPMIDPSNKHNNPYAIAYKALEPKQ